MGHHANTQETRQAPSSLTPDERGTTIYFFKVPGTGNWPYLTWIPIGANAGGPAGDLPHIPGVTSKTYFPNDLPPANLPGAPPRIEPFAQRELEHLQKWIDGYWTHHWGPALGLVDPRE